MLCRGSHPDSPSHSLAVGYWKNTLDSESAQTAFHPWTHDVYTQTLESTEQGVVDRVLSKSYITALSQEDRDNLVAEIRKIVQRGDGKVWIDQAQGIFGKRWAGRPVAGDGRRGGGLTRAFWWHAAEYKYKTDLYTFVKK